MWKSSSILDPLNLTFYFFDRQVWLHSPQLFQTSGVFQVRGIALNYFSFELVQLLTTIVSSEPWGFKMSLQVFEAADDILWVAAFFFLCKAELVLVKMVILTAAWTLQFCGLSTEHCRKLQELQLCFSRLQWRTREGLSVSWAVLNVTESESLLLHKGYVSDLVP